MSQINATGTHESHYRAERATVTARICIVSLDRQTSITQSTALHNHIAQRARQLRESGDATWHAAEAPSTGVRKSYAQGKAAKVVIEHVTSSVVRIKLKNLDLVSALVEELSTAGTTTEVDWSLTEESRRVAEHEARKAAVRAAREVADDYADALGERIVRVTSISEAPRGYGAPHARYASAASAEGAEITVAEITVSASVQGAFESA